MTVVPWRATARHRGPALTRRQRQARETEAKLLAAGARHAELAADNRVLIGDNEQLRARFAAVVEENAGLHQRIETLQRQAAEDGPPAAKWRAAQDETAPAGNRAVAADSPAPIPSWAITTEMPVLPDGDFRFNGGDPVPHVVPLGDVDPEALAANWQQNGGDR